MGKNTVALDVLQKEFAKLDKLRSDKLKSADALELAAQNHRRDADDIAGKMEQIERTINALK